MNLDIAPYVGVGPLRFGMTPIEVHLAVGMPVRAKQTQGKLREIYPFEAVLVFEGQSNNLCLVEMGFNRRCVDLAYGGMKLFGVPPSVALRRLLQDDPLAGEMLGFLVFPTLGVTMTGFHSGPEEDMAVTVFNRGRWDSDIASLKPFFGS